MTSNITVLRKRNEWPLKLRLGLKNEWQTKSDDRTTTYAFANSEITTPNRQNKNEENQKSRRNVNETDENGFDDMMQKQKAFQLFIQSNSKIVSLKLNSFHNIVEIRQSIFQNFVIEVWKKQAMRNPWAHYAWQTINE